MLRVFLVTLFFCVGIIACKGVRFNDLNGTWVLKDTSRQILPVELQTDRARMILKPDGTFVVSGMPGLFYAPQGAMQLDSGSGFWKLVSRDGKQQVQLDFYIKSGTPVKGGPFSTQLNVSRKLSKIKLFYFVGDPDDALRIDFEKK